MMLVFNKFIFLGKLVFGKLNVISCFFPNMRVNQRISPVAQLRGSLRQLLLKLLKVISFSANGRRYKSHIEEVSQNVVDVKCDCKTLDTPRCNLRLRRPQTMNYFINGHYVHGSRTTSCQVDTELRREHSVATSCAEKLSSFDLQIDYLDVQTAFLNGDLHEKIYMQQS